MSLRVRLILLVGLALLASLTCGSLLVAWHAANSVRTELRSALDGSAKMIVNEFDDLTYANDQTVSLRHLIATFNGNRHVRATLLDDRDQTVTTSDLLVPTEVVPDWFSRLIGGVPPAVRLAVPHPGAGGAAIVLRAEPRNEMGEVWDDSRDALTVLGFFAALSVLLIGVTVGQALRPLENLSIAFERIGRDDYDGSVPDDGPRELARLAKAFNLMTQRLAIVAAQNRRLNERLLTLQAEERADLARDLHDEIGPLLFAVDMTAATIEHLANGGQADGIPAHARSIHESTGRMQRSVRAILERLRPSKVLGLRTAIDQLAIFWRAQRPDIDFNVTISIDEVGAGNETREVIYRLIQEGLTNAVRHGSPARVDVAVMQDTVGDVRVTVTDDGIGLREDDIVPSGPAQFGLIGMRERVTAMAGSLSVQRGHDGKGLALVASIPGATSLMRHDQDEPE